MSEPSENPLERGWAWLGHLSLLWSLLVGAMAMLLWLLSLPMWLVGAVGGSALTLLTLIVAAKVKVDSESPFLTLGVLRTLNPPFVRPLVSPTAPIVVEFGLRSNKVLTIDNKGRVSIDDIQLFATEYFFDEAAWRDGKLKIREYQKGGDPLHTIPFVAGLKSLEVDLAEVAPHWLKFAKLDAGVYAWPTPDNLKFYCLRITFRDERSGEKYVKYRVTSSMKAPSVLDDGVSTTSPTDLFAFENGVSSVLIEHNKTLWANDTKEYLTPPPSSSPIPLATAKPSLKQRALSLSREIEEFMAERERTKPAPESGKSLHKYPEEKRDQIWRQRIERDYKYSRETMRLYRIRFHAEVNALLTEFKFLGIDTSRAESDAEDPVNPIGIHQVSTQLAALAGRLQVA